MSIAECAIQLDPGVRQSLPELALESGWCHGRSCFTATEGSGFDQRPGGHVPPTRVGRKLWTHYGDFSSTAGLHLNGNAARGRTALRLAPAINSQRGSAFLTTPVNRRDPLRVSSSSSLQRRRRGRRWGPADVHDS